MAPEFTGRNGIVNATRTAGESVRGPMTEQRRIVFVIGDMPAFMRAVYSENMDMSGFLEIALQKGREQKIHFFASVTPAGLVLVN